MSGTKFELVNSGPIVNQPGRIVESFPKICNRLLPKQKCSIIWNISTGFSKLPYSGSSDMIKSISTFAWIKSPSVDLRTVPKILTFFFSENYIKQNKPLMPIRQCSLVRWKTALGSKFLEWTGFLMLVLIQHISSHLKQNFPADFKFLIPKFTF